MHSVQEGNHIAGKIFYISLIITKYLFGLFSKRNS